MGQNGHWKKEGYSFKITDKDGFYQVLAFTKDNEKAGEALFRTASDAIGWTSIVPDDNHLSVTSVDVYPLHQRKGLATEMYRLVEEYSGKTIIESKVLQTKDAQAFWKNRTK